MKIAYTCCVIISIALGVCLCRADPKKVDDVKHSPAFEVNAFDAASVKTLASFTALNEFYIGEEKYKMDLDGGHLLFLDGGRVSK